MLRVDSPRFPQFFQIRDIVSPGYSFHATSDQSETQDELGTRILEVVYAHASASVRMRPSQGMIDLALLGHSSQSTFGFNSLRRDISDPLPCFSRNSHPKL
jgi:hypothetical protein